MSYLSSASQKRVRFTHLQKKAKNMRPFTIYYLRCTIFLVALAHLAELEELEEIDF